MLFIDIYDSWTQIFLSIFNQDATFQYSYMYTVNSQIFGTLFNNYIFYGLRVAHVL